MFKLIHTSVACLLALAATGQAMAGCKINAPQQSPSAQPSFGEPSSGRSSGNPMLVPAVYRPGQFQPAALTSVSAYGPPNTSVVGLWEFEVRATVDEGPFHKGDLLDWGLATWHDDGTEIQFSAGRPYDAGDVCMGVWQQTGRSSFHLNHIALGKDLATAVNFDGLTNIRADVTVDRSGNHFTGSYLIIQYYGDPAYGTEFDQSTELYRFVGAVTARRVLPN